MVYPNIVPLVPTLQAPAVGRFRAHRPVSEYLSLSTLIWRMHAHRANNMSASHWLVLVTPCTDRTPPPRRWSVSNVRNQATALLPACRPPSHAAPVEVNPHACYVAPRSYAYDHALSRNHVLLGLAACGTNLRVLLVDFDE